MAHQNTYSRRTFQALRITCIVTVTVVVAAAGPVFAQGTGQAEVAVGFLRNIGGTMQGVNVQAALPLGEHWHLVGEINRSTGADCSGCEPQFRDTSILGGARYSWYPSRSASPFWQVLVGGLHSKADDYSLEYCCGLGTRLHPGYTIDYLAFQPGGGVTFTVTPRFGIRAQADALIGIPDQREWEGISIFPRVVVTGVIRLGRTR